MKKVAIVTLNGNNNYGNRLQNYALQEILVNLGNEVETLDITLDVSNKKFNKITRNLKNILLHPTKIKKFFQKKEYGEEYKKTIILKESQITPFTNKYLNTKKCLESELFSLNDQYDYFITGSDQVWNVDSEGAGAKINFLYFVSENKRISYAASFGKSFIEKNNLAFYKKMLDGMNQISVREDAGKKIVENLTNKKATVHVDPTMLIEKNSWESLIKINNKKKNEEYILVYVLRELPYELKNELKELAEKRNLIVKYIMGDKILDNHEIPSVESFIDLINNANYVVTDSFHGTVFSIIMNTKFLVVDRKTGNMNSRIETLLNKFKFEDKIFNYNKDLESQFREYDFFASNKILADEKNKALSYFKEFLK